MLALVLAFVLAVAGLAAAKVERQQEALVWVRA